MGWKAAVFHIVITAERRKRLDTQLVSTVVEKANG